ncbi:MAG: ADP-ribosylglycohydrolase family protein [Kovacikia sp.]
MRYSLLSRFQGGLLGAALGASLGFEQPTQKSLQKKPDRIKPVIPITQVESQKPGSDWEQSPPERQGGSTTGYGKVAVRWAEVLIDQQEWTALEFGQSVGQMTAPAFRSDSGLSYPGSIAEAELAIATLPIALFFHDDEIRLRQMLEKAVCLQAQDVFAGGALAIGFAIAQALQERLLPLDLIPRTIDFLQQPVTHQPSHPYSTLIKKLEQGQTLLREETNLSMATRILLPSGNAELGSGAVALAFFCFLSTPEDMRLSLLRAARSSSSLRIVRALTGALAGAYNSTAGIPLEWSLVAADPTQRLDWQISGPDLCHLASRLLAAWSGASNPTAFANSSFAIAAPGLIRPR